MPTITRIFEFDYGHRVLGHMGPCRFPHGHRGKAEIVLMAPELNNLGMVLDFAEVKKQVGDWIAARWDHAFLLHPDDPLRPAFESDSQGARLYVMRSGNPTAEIMARELFAIAQALLLHRAKVVSVTIWETPSCSATHTLAS